MVKVFKSRRHHYQNFIQCYSEDRANCFIFKEMSGGAFGCGEKLLESDPYFLYLPAICN